MAILNLLERAGGDPTCPLIGRRSDFIRETVNCPPG